MLNKYFKKVLSGQSLGEEEMMEAVSFIMDGYASNSDLIPFLEDLHKRGETVDEIVGATRILRERAVSIQSPRGAIDCCGTGGDKTGTYNISTAVAFVAAAAGVPVAKHGNRASTSRCGAADILEILGVSLAIPVPALEESLKMNNFCFLLASRHHPAMKHVAVARKKINHPTLFNLVGPLSNPAGTKRQLIGVYDRRWLKPVAEALHRLGSEKAWVVHGADGMDEITTTTETHIAILENGIVVEKTIAPEDFGLKRVDGDKLKGGTGTDNATALRSLLEGNKGPYRDIVLANAAAVLCLHGSADDLKHGVDIARKAIDKGQALQTMKDYIVFTRENAVREEQKA